MHTPVFIIALTFTALAAFAVQPTAPAAAPGSAAVSRDDSAAEKLGWRLGVQAWTFRDRSAFEAIDTAHALGLKYIELYPGQPLAKDQSTVKVGPELTPEQRTVLKGHLAAAHVKAVSFGVVTLSTDEVAARKFFDFAKDMGLETLTCEPTPPTLDTWDLVERLANEYKINIAVHNHPKPSTYWDPDTVLAAIKDRSSRLGACADTGHWPRSGLNPVQCLKKLHGRIITSHFKDLHDGHDVPWGTGDSDAKAMLTELHTQGFKGVISVEYETGEGPELEANVAKCIGFFDKTAAELAGSPAKRESK
jgi:sugar phosphate isomerase/epimerase